MPGEENNPNLQPAGTSAGAGENVTPPVAGVQQVGVGVPDPTLQAIGDLQTAYNANGGPPAERVGGRNGAENERRVQNGGSRRTSGQNPRDLPAPPPPNLAQNEPPAVDLASKEGKFSVLDRLEPLGIEEEDPYVPNQNEILFAKTKWSFDGQDSFEDYVVRIGGYARTLGVGEICFKNTLFQSFRPPCSFIVSDMEPSMSLYRKMNRKEYVQALHERLEPASACDLIYTQFKERTQKAGEVYDLYLRDKYNLFIRSFPNGKTRIFKEFCESSIRGLHNEILRNKARDFVSIQSLNGFKIETFDQLRRIIQVSVENIQTRTIAGELDASDAIGTDIRLMNYSYTNAASSREKERKSRYEVNVMDENLDEDEIAAFRRFKKYQNQTGYKAKGIKGFTVPGRQPAEDDICYNCNGKGHFSRNCPRNNLPGRYQNVNKVEKSSPDTSDDIPGNQDTSSSDSDLEIDYVKEKKKPKPSQVKSKKKRRHIYQIVEEQGEQINSLNAKMSEICTLSTQLSELMSTMSGRKGEVNTLGATSVFPPDLEDINREGNDDIFAFL
jgi:hypothetical protein